MRFESGYKYHADKLQTRELPQSFLVRIVSLIVCLVFLRKGMYISITRNKSKYNYLFALCSEGDQRYLGFLERVLQFVFFMNSYKYRIKRQLQRPVWFVLSVTSFSMSARTSPGIFRASLYRFIIYTGSCVPTITDRGVTI